MREPKRACPRTPPNNMALPFSCDSFNTNWCFHGTCNDVVATPGLYQTCNCTPGYVLDDVVFHNFGCTLPFNFLVIFAGVYAAIWIPAFLVIVFVDLPPTRAAVRRLVYYALAGMVSEMGFMIACAVEGGWYEATSVMAFGKSVSLTLLTYHIMGIILAPILAVKGMGANGGMLRTLGAARASILVLSFLVFVLQLVYAREPGAATFNVIQLVMMFLIGLHTVVLPVILYRFSRRLENEIVALRTKLSPHREDQGAAAGSSTNSSSASSPTTSEAQLGAFILQLRHFQTLMVVFALGVAPGFLGAGIVVLVLHTFPYVWATSISFGTTVLTLFPMLRRFYRRHPTESIHATPSKELVGGMTGTGV